MTTNTAAQPARQQRRIRLLVALGLCVAYTAVYLLTRPIWGLLSPAFSLVPVFYIGWHWGLRGGLIASITASPFHTVLNYLVGYPWKPDITLIPGMLILVVTGVASGWIGNLVTRVRLQAETLRADQTRLRTIFGQLPALLWTTDTNLVITSGMGRRPNPDQTQADQALMVGKSIYELCGTGSPAPVPLSVHLRALTGQAGTYETELYGHYFECHVEPFYDHAGAIVGTIGIALDISDRHSSEEALRRSEERLRHLADHDPLTHLYNRRRFQEELDDLLATPAPGPTAVLFLDVDGFKYVNDSLGHQAGDDLLKSLAGLLRHELQGAANPFIARLGGDEFAVILPGADAEAACEVARRLVQAARGNSVMVRGRPVVANVSIGVAVAPHHGRTAEALLAHADLAMYQAKENGRNGYALYEPGSGGRSQSEEKLTWEARIRHALAADRFVLYAQPIHALAGGEITHYELLLRMIGDQGEVILPGAFLDVAERFGLIREIDRWVVANAIRLSAALSEAGEACGLAVNLSGKAFTDPELLPLVLHELDKAGADPTRLVLEITETALINDIEQACHWVRALRQVGCKFAIDDFGAGFSSFSYLRRLPVDYIKIDGSFIQNLPHDAVNQHLVRSMVEMARGLGMQTVGEFVGDEATVRLIQACGVDFAQGFHIGRPAPIEHWWPRNSVRRIINT